MYVLIPAYEPKDKVLDIVNDILKRTKYKILVVDDGSALRYQKIFYELETIGVKVLHHDKNLGKGEALKTGFKYIKEIDNNASVICADCDGQHKTEDIIKVGNAINEKDKCIVIGVRKFNGKVPIKSRIGNSVTSIIFALTTGKYISDTQTGLRGYPSSLIRWLVDIDGDRFEYELNILLQTRVNKIKIKEIPILTIYENNNSGTHFRPVVDSLRVYIPIIKFSGSSIISGIIDFSLLILINKFTDNLLISVVTSRVFSSIFNYFVNKRFVFEFSGKSYIFTALKYFTLVIIILTLNYALMYLLKEIINLPIVIAKFSTESLLFTLSYILQRKLVFKS